MLLQYDADTVTVKFVIIRPDYRARGYGTDTLIETVRYAFEELDAEYVTLQVSPDNGPALICFENAGFQYQSYTDTTRQTYIMGIERNEWAGEETVEAQDMTPQLSAPLKLFFEPEE